MVTISGPWILGLDGYRPGEPVRAGQIRESEGPSSTARTRQ
jgi:hypothetical protein